ncbi:MAG: KpsF/GutQ family sugar-phosphate isomerase [Planctomycetes bacterium]|nr:KpsF/GutQ family sugar-phosphate isomerase [Planctomycetota bacterium]
MELRYAKEVLKTEMAAIRLVASRLNSHFVLAVRLILKCKGRVVVTGMGKAGIIGQKISATLASTGTPSLFLHPAEAYHGDLGRVTKDDIVLALSNSGTTNEIIQLLPSLKKIGVKIIAVTGSRKSQLGKYSNVVLEIGRVSEACHWGLVPSASTTAMLALGDALSLTVFRNRKLTKRQYALYHPGGELGRKLLRVKEIMRQGKQNPIIPETKTVQAALRAITKSRAGAISVVNKQKKLTGIFTDGDLRRHVGSDPRCLQVSIKKIMTRRPITVGPEKLAAEALQILRDKKIDEIPVVDKKGRPIGMLDVQDLLSAGIV